MRMRALGSRLPISLRQPMACVCVHARSSALALKAKIAKTERPFMVIFSDKDAAF